MSRIDENGITHNSFYETERDLGIEPKSDEELIEYKRLIGMPITEDYDELIASLKPNSHTKKDSDASADDYFTKDNKNKCDTGSCKNQLILKHQKSKGKFLV